MNRGGIERREKKKKKKKNNVYIRVMSTLVIPVAYLSQLLVTRSFTLRVSRLDQFVYLSSFTSYTCIIYPACPLTPSFTGDPIRRSWIQVPPSPSSVHVHMYCMYIHPYLSHLSSYHPHPAALAAVFSIDRSIDEDDDLCFRDPKR